MKALQKNGQDRDGKTPLMVAIERGHVQAARYLVKAGANLNTQDNSGRNARDYARASGNREIRELLQK